MVIPGGIATDIKKNSDIKFNVSTDSSKSKMMLTPAKAAALIMQAMEQNKLRSYIGKDCKVMNTFYKVSPRLGMNLMNKVMNSNEH